MRVLSVLMTLLLVASPAFAKGRKKPAAARTGRLAIQTTVVGAEVAIDGVVVGTTPVDKPLTLAVGTHSVKVSRAGYAEFLDVVKIRPDETTTLDVDLLPFAAAVTVDSNPPGADITVDGKLVGVTPAQLELDAGERTIRVTLDGYKPNEKTMKVAAGQTYSVMLPLEVIVVAKPGGGKKRKPIYAKWWFWAATSAVVVGTTAIVIGASSGGDSLDGVDRVLTPEW